MHIHKHNYVFNYVLMCMHLIKPIKIGYFLGVLGYDTQVEYYFPQNLPRPQREEQHVGIFKQWSGRSRVCQGFVPGFSPEILSHCFTQGC